jgi:hypothetical protein
MKFILRCIAAGVISLGFAFGLSEVLYSLCNLNWVLSMIIQLVGSFGCLFLLWFDWVLKS